MSYFKLLTRGADAFGLREAQRLFLEWHFRAPDDHDCGRWAAHGRSGQISQPADQDFELAEFECA